MGMTASYKHSFNSGDLITVLPGIKKIWEETGHKAVIYQRLDMPANYSHLDPHPVKDKEGISVCMNKAMFDMMKPLILHQPYVESFEIWQGEKVDFDFDLTRHNSLMPLPGGSILHWPSLIFPQLNADHSWAWMDSEEFTPLVKNKIIINRTQRYHNPYIDYYFLKAYERDVIFAGTKKEHEAFCADFNLQLPHLIVKDFLELATHIKSCRFFIGNQSMCFHLADAQKTPRILEVCSTYPNTFPTGNSGYAFILQPALEYFFNNLIKFTE